MELIAKCKCQHCDQNIEFEQSAAGKSVTCPSCELETVLFIRSNYHPPAPAKIAHSNLRSIAERFISAANLCCALTVLAGIVTFLAFIGKLSDGGEWFTTIAIGASVASGLLGTAAGLYLIGQIVHIRANTEKE